MFDVQSLLKYLLEGLAVGVATYLIPQKQIDAKEVILISLTAAAIFAILDNFSPLTGAAARQGAGFGLGFQNVQYGMGRPNFEGYDDYANAEGIENQDNQARQMAQMSQAGQLGQMGQAGQPGQSGQMSQSPQAQQYAEGFYTQDAQNPQDREARDPSMCHMSADGSACTYAPNVKPKHKAQYICHKDNDKCMPVKACKMSPEGACELDEQVKNSGDLMGRACHQEEVNGKKYCAMGLPKDTKSADEIEGFGGFGKNNY